MSPIQPKSRWPRVVDFSTHFSGPMASRELVHLGADVIKVERPIHGDGNRAIGGQVAGSSAVHHALSSGTRSVVMDRRSAGWSAFVERIVASADAVIVGARPSDADSRGLGFERLVEINPGLVYCAITGYGDDGPWADRPAHGLQPDLMAGAVALEWTADGPRIPESYKAHGTAMAGLWAAIGILGALLRQTRQPGAQYVSVSIWEAALAWMWREALNEANGLEQRASFQQLGSRYRLYAGSDGEAVLVCPIEAKFWAAFVDAIDLPSDWRERGSWLDGADYGHDHPGEAAAIAERIATRPAAEWERILDDAGVPVALVRPIGDAIRSPQAAARGSLAKVAGPAGSVEVPLPPLSVTPVVARGDATSLALAARHRERGMDLSPAPSLGQHTAEVLHELGLESLIAATTSPSNRNI